MGANDWTHCPDCGTPRGVETKRMWNCARCVARLKKNARARKSARKRYREQNPHLAEKSLRRCAAGPQIDISELPGEGDYLPPGAGASNPGLQAYLAARRKRLTPGLIPRPKR